MLSSSRSQTAAAIVAGLLTAIGCGRSEPASSSTARPGETGTSYLVTVSRQAGGTVTSADGRIRCGTAATATACGPVAYAWTEAATLIATPDAGFMFGTWAGDCTGRARNAAGQYACALDTVTYGADKFVAAVFGVAGRAQHGNFGDPALHGAEFLARVANEPETFDCAYCHGSTLDGLGIARSCNDCHAKAGHEAWRTDCTFCHGAPPQTAVHARVPVENPLRTCSICHAATVTASGTIIEGGGHMNGRLDAPAGGGACDACHGAPPSTGAHLAHAGAKAPSAAYGDSRPFGCGNCHPTDPARHGTNAQELNAAVVLPGGTVTAGAVMTGSGMGVSCSVACHSPLGAPQPAATTSWTTAGPLACKDCHSRFTAAGLGGNDTATPPAGPSLHDPLYAEARPASGEATTCWSCHDSALYPARHATGDRALLGAAVRDVVCVSCHTPPPGPTGPSQVLHRGSGEAYVEKTPPVLPGWTDPANGDFHGVRAGTGYGGTLDGFERGAGALSCSACHASHQSGNAFKFAAVVNGREIPGGRISRSGVGAEILCNACHVGDHHAGCQVSGCHDGGMNSNGTQRSLGDPKPAGSACFLCHGHEGIRRFPPPYIAYGPHDEPAGDRNCSHCHSAWAPVAEYSRLFITPDGTPPQASGITSSSATITWATNRAATTYVEYGVGTAGYVVGNAAEMMTHSVTLTGLSPGTTYVWRVRSTDASRNVVHSATQSFTTTAAAAVPRPDVATVYAGTTAPATQATARLLWYPVTAPSGTAVQYEVQLASDAGFTTLLNAAMARVDPSNPASIGTSGWTSGIQTLDNSSPRRSALGYDVLLTNLPQDDCGPVQPVNTYYFRVRARDALGNVSAWSNPVGSFGAGAGDPYGC